MLQQSGIVYSPLRSEDGSISSINQVSKCLTVPENEMNIYLDVVKYSDVDFRIFNAEEIFKVVHEVK